MQWISYLYSKLATKNKLYVAMCQLFCSKNKQSKLLDS